MVTLTALGNRLEIERKFKSINLALSNAFLIVFRFFPVPVGLLCGRLQFAAFYSINCITSGSWGNDFNFRSGIVYGKHTTNLMQYPSLVLLFFFFKWELNIIGPQFTKLIKELHWFLSFDVTVNLTKSQN